MKILISKITVLCCFLASANAIANSCPSGVGETVQPRKADDIYNIISNSMIKKGEFETTAEFEARKAASGNAALTKTWLVEIKYDPEYTIYDADSQKLKVFSTAWDRYANIGTGWETVFNYHGRKKYGIKIRTRGEAHGLSLQTIQNTVGSYVASNRYGAKVTVTKIEQSDFSLFDRPVDGPRSFPRKLAESWLYDGRGNYERKNVSTPSIRGFVNVDLPISKAKVIKNTMRASVYFTPKAPILLLAQAKGNPDLNGQKK